MAQKITAPRLPLPLSADRFEARVLPGLGRLGALLEVPGYGPDRGRSALISTVAFDGVRWTRAEVEGTVLHFEGDLPTEIAKNAAFAAVARSA